MGNDDQTDMQTITDLNDTAPRGPEPNRLESDLQWAQGSQLLAVRILTLLNRQIGGKEAIREILGMVKQFTGFEAVAIRLRDGDDFPYFVTNGFPDDFVEAENSLCVRTEAGEIVRDAAGKPVLECMCGNILCGRTNPAFSFFTEGGSFWSSHTTELLATTTEADRQARTRNRCNSVGYESVALIPLRSDRETIGLLQLNDSRKDCFTRDMITFFEGLGASIGIVLAQTNTREALRRANEELEARVRERTYALLAATERLRVEIADHKRALTELKQEKSFSDALIDSLPGIFHCFDEQGRALRWNRRLEQLLGYSAEEVSTMHPLDLIQEDHRNAAKESIQAILEKGEDSLELSLVTKDGKPVPLLLSGRRIHRDQQYYVLGTGTDITERKKIEEALSASEKKYRTLFDQSRDGVYRVAEDGEITDANQAFLELFGYTEEEMIGRDIRTLYANPADRSRFVVEIEKTGFVRDYEVRFRKKDGKDIDCLVTSTLRHEEDGAISGYQGIIRDVSERKRLEQQLRQAQKMEAVGTLAGGIAHDFNNVLTVVLGYSELLLANKELGTANHEDLQKVADAAERGATLVRRLLTFSRKAETNPRPVDLNSQVRQVREMLTRTIPKMIDVDLVLAEDLPAINADPTQLDQILMNLAVNARDAMPGGGTLTIETAPAILDEEYAGTHPESKTGEHVLLTVSDTGQGMDKETLERIFEPFFTTKKAGQGTGLGLAMAYGIVQQHHGRIMCFSEPGRGTTFKIYFPKLTGEAKDSEHPPRKHEIMGGNESILLVDDEQSIRDLGSRILKKAGYRVVTAANGKRALEEYRRRGGEVSLVILDLIMPEMGGKQCLEELRNFNPDVKVLVASGFASKTSPKEALELGAKGFVSKPFNITDLLHAVRDALNA